MAETHDASHGDAAAMKSRVLTSAALGSVLEWYDFSIFGFLAPQIGAAFFGGDNSASTATLKAFCVYGGAFAMRPLGAVLFGHVGDGGGGRGRALSWAILLMALPSLAIGCLPTYASAGRNATIALVVLRLIQGLSVGGQLAGAYVSVVEAAPPARRGLWGSLCSCGNSLGARRRPAAATTFERSRPGTPMNHRHRRVW